MGSRQKATKEDYAYIAGFLDGDGSIMVQVKNRRGTPRGWRLMCTLCFYQDSRHKEPLTWIQNTLGIGYIAHRNDKITELRINGYREIEAILELLKPYVKFKAHQTDITLRILKKLNGKRFVDLSRKDRLIIAENIIRLRGENYKAHRRRYSDEELRNLLGF